MRHEWIAADRPGALATSVWRATAWALVLACSPTMHPMGVRAQDEVPSARAPEIPDSAWSALLDTRVELSQDDGAVLTGRLLDVSEATVTVVLADGSVAVVARGTIAGVRRLAVEPTAEKPVHDSSEAVQAPAKLPMSERRGFYLAGSLGIGVPYYWDTYEGVGEPYSGTETMLTPGLNAGVAVGGALVPGLLLGFALDVTTGPGRYEDDYGAFVTERDGRGYAIGVAAFLQGYIGNFFLRAGVGGAGVFIVHETDTEAGGGPGFDFQLGAHFPVTRSVALGFSVGIRAAFLGYDNDEYRGRARFVQPLVRFDAVLF